MWPKERVFALEWVSPSARLGGLNATSVITLAVSDLYQRKQAEWTARLVLRDDAYELQIGGIPIAACAPSVLDKLPQPTRDQLLGDRIPQSGALAALVLAGAASGEKMTIYPDAIATIYGSDEK